MEIYCKKSYPYHHPDNTSYIYVDCFFNVLKQFKYAEKQQKFKQECAELNLHELFLNQVKFISKPTYMLHTRKAQTKYLYQLAEIHLGSPRE